jgi:hypothetical protein
LFWKPFSKELFRDVEDRGLYKGYTSKNVTMISNAGGGFTLRLGSPKSSLLVRLYNKSFESKNSSSGHIDAHRVEAQYRDSLAAQVFDDIVACGDDVGKFAELIVGAATTPVRLIDRTADKNVSRCPVLPWWQEILDVLKATPRKWLRTKFTDSIITTKKWIEKKVVASIATVFEAIGRLEGKQWLLDEIRKGGCRLSKKQQSQVNSYRRQCTVDFASGAFSS